MKEDEWRKRQLEQKEIAMEERAEQNEIIAKQRRHTGNSQWE
jgi:hypothetical protein